MTYSFMNNADCILYKIESRWPMLFDHNLDVTPNSLMDHLMKSVENRKEGKTQIRLFSSAMENDSIKMIGLLKKFDQCMLRQCVMTYATSSTPVHNTTALFTPCLQTLPTTQWTSAPKWVQHKWVNKPSQLGKKAKEKVKIEKLP